MNPFKLPCLLAAGALTIAASIPAVAQGTLITQEFDFDLTIADDPFGNGRTFNLLDGSVSSLGVNPGTFEFNLIPSNLGRNLQVQFAQNSGGGAVITEVGAPQLRALAQNFTFGDVIGPAIPDVPALPGFSDALSEGAGRIRFFGSGNFESGERGFLGFRVAGVNDDLHFGYAEITGTDNLGFVLHRTVLESIPFAPITVAAAIPEPSTFGILGLIGLSLYARPRRA